MREGGLQKPSKLPDGGCVGIVAPSSAVRTPQLADGIRCLTDRGFRVVLGEHVYDRWGYLAGTDEARASDLTEMFARKDVSAVICARGGYGAARMVDGVDWDVVRANPKVFVGYSDITTLHLAMERRAGLMTFHGPMVTTLGSGIGEAAERLLWRLLSTPEPEIDLLNGSEIAKTLASGLAHGRLSGGCLSILCAALGTPEAPDFAGRIVLLEDTDEPLYRVDRLLTQLVRSGCVDEAAGFVIGTVTNWCQSHESSWLRLDDLWLDILGPLGKPIVVGADFGHVDSPLTLPLGCSAALDADRRTLRLTEAAVV